MNGSVPATRDAWDVEELRGFIGREVSATDRVRVRVARQLLDLAGSPETRELLDGALAPLGIHWCLAPPEVPIGGLQQDGHPRADQTILPPVPHSRRMWAGGELRWHDPIRLGDLVTRRSVIADVTIKDGRSGALCFVTARHDYSTARGCALTERQDIVYKRADAEHRQAVSGAGAATPPRAPANSGLRDVITDPVRLFRYSALTGNAHRIHYDHPYATQVEGYPGLVVHGPLQATMLMQAAEGLAGRNLSRFSYRAISPLFCGEAVVLLHTGEAPDVSLWTCCTDGRVGMRADARWESA